MMYIVKIEPKESKLKGVEIRLNQVYYEFEHPHQICAFLLNARDEIKNYSVFEAKDWNRETDKDYITASDNENHTINLGARQGNIRVK